MKRIVLVFSLILFLNSHSLVAQDKPIWGFDKSNWQEISFTAKYDQTEQLYTILLPENFNPDQPYNLLMVFHGMYGDCWQLYNLRTEGPCQAIMEIAQENQLIVVAPDYRIDQWMGPAGEADTLQIIVELQRKYRINKVFIVGGSMGGSSVLTLIVRHPYLFDGAFSMNGTANYLEYQNYQDYIQKGFGGTKAEIPLEYKNRSAEYWPERIIMPLSLTVGGQDGAVPHHSVTRLANILQQMKRKVLYIYREEVGHGTLYEDARAGLDFALGLEPKKEDTPK